MVREQKLHRKTIPYPLYMSVSPLRLAEELVQLMKKGPLNPDAMNVSQCCSRGLACDLHCFFTKL